MRWMIAFFCFLGFAGEVAGQNEIGFRVDLSDAFDREFFVPANGDRVILRGTFTEWGGDALELRDEDGDGIFAGVFTLDGEAGTEIEYKYLLQKPDGKVFWEWQPNPDNPPFGNRIVKLTGNPQNVETGEFFIDRYDLAAVGMPVLFSVEDLREDFAQLRKNLEKRHCCLYEYTSEDEFDALFDRQQALIDRPMQAHEFFRLVVAPVAAAIGCGQSSVWLSEAYWTYAGESIFPLQLRMMDGHPVVVGYFGEDRQVPVGSILEEIDERPAGAIFEELVKLCSADAHNRNFRISQVERRFPMLYAGTYGFAPGFRVKYALPGRKTSAEATLRSTGLDRIRPIVFPAPKPRFAVRDDRTAAVMTISSFSYYDRVPYFRAFLDSCFQLIDERGIGKLILDIRGNDGGDPFCAALLFSYLEKAPVPYFAEEYGSYAELTAPVPRAARPFRGRLVVLVDGGNFSTSGHFCALLKMHGIGILVGSETGGSFACNAAIEQLHLDHTRLLQFIPTTTYLASVTGMDRARGVFPDHLVRQNYQDFLAGKDTTMEFALRLLEKGD